MKNNIINAIDSVLIVLGVGVGLDTIESLLGIIILVIQILWILSKFAIRIYHNIKNKNYDDVDDALKDSIDELDTLKNNIKKGGGQNDK